jgi:hypothetical protein
MFEMWMVTAVANAVMVMIYGLMSVGMIRAIIDGAQLRSNPLLTATAAVFITCTLGHGAHLMHGLFATAMFWGDAEGAAAAVRAKFGDPRLLYWDSFTALTAIYFFTLRSRMAIVYRGAALCEDMEQREAQALALHDDIVQALTEAKLAMETGHKKESRAAVERSLAASRQMITDLLGAEGSENELGPGRLRRRKAAGGEQ